VRHLERQKGNSNDKWQMAKFKWFSVCPLNSELLFRQAPGSEPRSPEIPGKSNRKSQMTNHLPFALCHLNFEFLFPAA
jgi:hypothetical protein